MAAADTLLAGWDDVYGWNTGPISVNGDPVYTDAAVFEVEFTAAFSEQFDQAGVFVRVSGTTPAPTRYSALVAHPHSGWMNSSASGSSATRALRSASPSQPTPRRRSARSPPARSIISGTQCPPINGGSLHSNTSTLGRFAAEGATFASTFTRPSRAEPVARLNRRETLLRSMRAAIRRSGY